jgi:hypothetical protein
MYLINMYYIFILMRLYQRLRVIHDALRVGVAITLSRRSGRVIRAYISDIPGRELGSTVWVGTRSCTVPLSFTSVSRGTFVGVCAMFAIRLVPDHDLVIDTVGVRAPLGVLSFVVLHDKALFPFGNVVPVSFESDW